MEIIIDGQKYRVEGYKGLLLQLFATLITATIIAISVYVISAYIKLLVVCATTGWQAILK
jgi:hypothetical protein